MDNFGQIKDHIHTVPKTRTFKACVSNGPADQELCFTSHYSLWDLRMMMQYQNLFQVAPACGGKGEEGILQSLSLDNILHMKLGAMT